MKHLVRFSPVFILSIALLIFLVCLCSPSNMALASAEDHDCCSAGPDQEMANHSCCSRISTAVVRILSDPITLQSQGASPIILPEPKKAPRLFHTIQSLPFWPPATVLRI